MAVVFLAPPSKWRVIAAIGYGFLLGIKLAIVLGMLGLAGLNRFGLV